jgi:hypothetical protein
MVIVPRNRYKMLSIAGLYLSLNESAGRYYYSATSGSALWQENMRNGASDRQVVWEYDEHIPILCNGPYQAYYMNWCGSKI